MILVGQRIYHYGNTGCFPRPSALQILSGLEFFMEGKLMENSTSCFQKSFSEHTKPYYTNKDHWSALSSIVWQHLSRVSSSCLTQHLITLTKDGRYWTWDVLYTFRTCSSSEPCPPVRVCPPILHGWKDRYSCAFKISLTSHPGSLPELHSSSYTAQRTRVV